MQFLTLKTKGMRSKLVNESPETHVLIFESGDEVVEGITDFAVENGLFAASLSAIGAFSSVELGYFDAVNKTYKRIPVKEQVEVLSLIGDIVLYDNKPHAHAHVVVGKADGTAHGGHLLKAYVKPTLEVILTALPTYLHRELDNEARLPLIKI